MKRTLSPRPLSVFVAEGEEKEAGDCRETQRFLLLPPPPHEDAHGWGHPRAQNGHGHGHGHADENEDENEDEDENGDEDEGTQRSEGHRTDAAKGVAAPIASG